MKINEILRRLIDTIENNEELMLKKNSGPDHMACRAIFQLEDYVVCLEISPKLETELNANDLH